MGDEADHDDALMDGELGYEAATRGWMTDITDTELTDEQVEMLARVYAQFPASRLRSDVRALVAALRSRTAAWIETSAGWMKRCRESERELGAGTRTEPRHDREAAPSTAVRLPRPRDGRRGRVAAGGSLYTGGTEMTTTATTLRWCLFCQGLFDPALNERCPRVCDRGGHESLAQPDEEFEVRRGSSLHVGSCPRSDPHPLLPRSVPCLCAFSQEADQ